MTIGNQTFEDGLNAMALIVTGVLERRGIPQDGAVAIVNEALDHARKQIAIGDHVVITSVNPTVQEASE